MLSKTTTHTQSGPGSITPSQMIYNSSFRCLLQEPCIEQVKTKLGHITDEVLKAHPGAFVRVVRKP